VTAESHWEDMIKFRFLSSERYPASLASAVRTLRGLIAYFRRKLAPLSHANHLAGNEKDSDEKCTYCSRDSRVKHHHHKKVPQSPDGLMIPFIDPNQQAPYFH
jgi:hypothetical protein